MRKCLVCVYVNPAVIIHDKILAANIQRAPRVGAGCGGGGGVWWWKRGTSDLLTCRTTGQERNQTSVRERRSIPHGQVLEDLDENLQQRRRRQTSAQTFRNGEHFFLTSVF
jgi:hypothetical protein